MGTLLKVRRDHVRRQVLGVNGLVLDAWGRPEDDALVQVVRRTWRDVGWGFLILSHEEAWLAAARHENTGRSPERNWNDFTA